MATQFGKLIFLLLDSPYWLNKVRFLQRFVMHSQQPRGFLDAQLSPSVCLIIFQKMDCWWLLCLLWVAEPHSEDHLETSMKSFNSSYGTPRANLDIPSTQLISFEVSTDAWRNHAVSGMVTAPSSGKASGHRHKAMVQPCWAQKQRNPLGTPINLWFPEVKFMCSYHQQGCGSKHLNQPWPYLPQLGSNNPPTRFSWWEMQIING